MRRLAPALLLFAAAAASAQAPNVQDSQAPNVQAPQAPRGQDSKPLDPRKNQKIERIHVEDNAVAIDELRYAGQTQSITVTPKGDLPAYEIVPANPARTRNDDARRASAGGERVWNLFSF